MAVSGSASVVDGGGAGGAVAMPPTSEVTTPVPLPATDRDGVLGDENGADGGVGEQLSEQVGSTPEQALLSVEHRPRPEVAGEGDGRADRELQRARAAAVDACGCGDAAVVCGRARRRW
jgi:hypothetical protein